MERQYLRVMCLLTLLKFSLQEKGELLSFQKPTKQSSTYHSKSQNFTFYADLAVDGKTNQRWEDKDCSCTERSKNSWWQVDLEGLARVNSVMIYSDKIKYGEQLGGFKVFLSNDTINDVLCADGPQRITNGEIIILDCVTGEAVRFVRIKLNSLSGIYLVLCEVKVYGQWIEKDELLSLGKPTKQSSTYKNQLFKFPTVASLAVDGNIDQIWGDQSCSSTQWSIMSWWQMMLEGLARVTYVSVYSEKIRYGVELGGFNVFLTNDTLRYKLCANGPQTTTNGQIINLKCEKHGTGRIFEILLNSDTKRQLVLCEVMIYGYWIEKDELLSYQKPTNQSSTYYNDKINFSAVSRFAVDGDIINLWDDLHCSSTTESINPWWQVNLVGLARITFVSIYRSFIKQNLDGFDVLLSNDTKNDVLCANVPHNTTDDDDEEIINLKCENDDNAVRIVRVKLNGDTKRQLVLCEVMVYGNWIERDELLSYQKPATQSSTYYSEKLKFASIASLAVNGNIDPIWKDKSCSRTTESVNPWWQLNLVGLARVTYVSVFSDDTYGVELGGFQVFLSNDTKHDVLCGDGPRNTTNGQIINLKCENDDNAVRIVRIKLSGDTRKQLVLCEVMVYGNWIQKDELLSEGMPATQSSTYHSYTYQFVAVASMAVDGNINQLWGDKTCSCTTKSTNPWWQVDFVGLVRVTYVTVYNRKNKGDRLSGFKVFLSNDTINDVLCADGPHNTTNGQIINLKCQNDDKAVRIVRIKLPSVSQYLTLCEVKVYGQWIEKDELLSEKMPTSQSSTFFGKSEIFYYDSSLAVDGNINQEWTRKSCSSTKNSGDRWWQLYLIGAARVSLVSIYTAVDENNQLSEFNVLAGLSIYKLEVCASVPQAVTSGRIIGLKCEDLLAARFIRIQLVGDRKRYLTLCEVKIYGELIRTDDLLSNDRSAIQSSIQRHRAFSIHASNAVDGNTNQRLSENSCTMTKNGKDSWWMVDLVTLHWVRQNYAAVSVRFVSIYNRGDCCGEWLSGFKVLISGKPFKYFRECASGPEKTRTGEIIHLECRATAQYLRIQLFGEDTTLSLCEVKIYGVPFR